MAEKRRTVLITGGRGRLAHSVIPVLEAGGWDVHAIGREALDITDIAQVVTALRGIRPDSVLNLAAWTDADAAERLPEAAHAVNVSGVKNVAEVCESIGAHLCHLSSDYVFDGKKGGSYCEQDEARPLSQYGRTKLAGEQAVGPDAAVVRTAWVSGESGRNIVGAILDQARDPSRTLSFVNDQRGSPTYAGDLSVALECLLSEQASGLFHVTNSGDATWYELARFVMKCAGDDPERVRPIRTDQLVPARPAPRPQNSVLENRRLRELGIDALPAWQESFETFVIEQSARRMMPSMTENR